MQQLPDATRVEAGLVKQGVQGVSVHAFEQLASTSQWLKEQSLIADTAAQPVLIQGGLKGITQGPTHLCIADSQVAGIGRRGKSWQTLPGNITFSVSSSSERLPQDLMGLSLVTGLAVCKVLRDEFSLDIALKWPNDVICGHAKLGGLLTEIVAIKNTDAASDVGEGPGSEPIRSQIITGIGINVLYDPSVVALGIGATSLEEQGIILARSRRDELIGSIAASVLLLHQQFFAQGWTPFKALWKRVDWLAGKEISIHRESSAEQGVARGVNDQGALLVETQGEIKPLFGGNVSIRPTV